jgi:hypothetical protein
MDEELDLSFAALTARRWIDTLAYWIGRYDLADLHDINALGITAAMSYQYDVEEGADRTGRVMPEDAGWRDRFAPVAPVQLTRAWSPLPCAIELLGSPDWRSVEPDALGTLAVACVWRSPRPRPQPPPDDADQSRFHQLLVVTVDRAGDNDQAFRSPSSQAGHTTTPTFPPRPPA